MLHRSVTAEWAAAALDFSIRSVAETVNRKKMPSPHDVEFEVLSG
jgi:hypothetical protein